MFCLLPTQGYDIPIGTNFEIEIPTLTFNVKLSLKVTTWDIPRAIFKFEVYQGGVEIGSVLGRQYRANFHQHQRGVDIVEYSDQILGAFEKALAEYFRKRGPIYLAKDCQKERINSFKKLFSVRGCVKKNNRGPSKRY